jgi:segregation and condensation protein A
MFYPGMHKTAMIGVFLSILELVRHHSVRTEQEDLHGEIWILPGEVFSESLDLSNVDTYGEPPADNAPQPLAKAA